MYRIDVQAKRLIKIPATSFSSHGLKERFDIQEWIEKTPEILGEPLLIIAKELILPSGRRLDLLAIDKNASLVVIELKRDDSGVDVEWQAIKYASYCSNFSQEDIYRHFAAYLGKDSAEAQTRVEKFIADEPERLNAELRIVLVATEFHSEVLSAALWLREFDIDVTCIRLSPHSDELGNLFVNPEILIPLPEAKDYIQKKAAKQREQKGGGTSSFSMDKSNLLDDDLRESIVQSLSRSSDLTPRLRTFFEILLSEDRAFDREEVKRQLLTKGIGSDIGHAGRLLSNISQFLTKKSNPHLRQVIEFDSGGEHGETKNNYRVLSQYRSLLKDALKEQGET